MGLSEHIESIEAEWSPDDGFFWRIRQGDFSEPHFERVMEKLHSFAIGEDDSLPRRLVSLLWYIPKFMEWQSDRVRKHGGNMPSYEGATEAITAEIERLLGVP